MQGPVSRVRSLLQPTSSFSYRPDFPRGLRVFLLDAESPARIQVEQQLHDCHYNVTSCSDAVQAIAALGSSQLQPDLVLADTSLLVARSSEAAELLSVVTTLDVPLLLMCSHAAPTDVMLSLRLGGVGFLDRPIGKLAIQNLWQHTVRRQMSGPGQALPPAEELATCVARHPPSPAPPLQLAPPHPLAAPSSERSVLAPALGKVQLVPLPQDSGSHLNSASVAGESGSNASTSGHQRMDADTDMFETSSAFGVAAAALVPGQAVHLGPIPSGMPAPVSAVERYSSAPTPAHSVGPGPVHLGGDRPPIGLSAGQLPPLHGEGMAWGLPTNPIQFGAQPPPHMIHMPMLPWAAGGMMPTMMMHPSHMHPMVMAHHRQLATAAAAAAATRSTTPLAEPAARSVAPLPVQALGVPGMIPTPASAASCALSMRHAASVAALGSSPVPMDAAAHGAAQALRSDILLSAFDESAGSASAPPLGLHLRKSMSFADLINSNLQRSRDMVTA